MGSGTDTALRTDLAGLSLANPVLMAAGTAGYIDELTDAVDLSRVGAVVTKSITAEPREGNPTWRILETQGGMLNAIGLANVGADVFEQAYAPKAAAPSPRGSRCVIGSVAGDSVESYTRVVEMFGRVDGVRGVEVNVSCPNVHGGCAFGDDPGALRELTAACRAALPKAKPLLIKLPPVLAGMPEYGIVALAAAAIESGADGLTIANTLPAMDIDISTRAPRLANVTGGLSGPAVRTVGIRLVHLVYRGIAKDAGIPIVGLGGVSHWRDAAAYVLAGASAVGVGTASFADPRAPQNVVKGLSGWIRRERVASISELVGAARL